jgi:predicted phage terminase large subunit-like protein
MKLSKQQGNFIKATTRGKIYLGSIGSGKTRVMCLNALLESLNGNNTLISSFSYRNLKDVVLTTLIELATEMKINFKVNQSDMVFKTNSNILLRSADNHDKLRSFNLHSFFVEEGRELTREVFDILLGRLRVKEDGFWGVVSTTRGKDWIYDIIKDEDLESIFDEGETIKSNKNLTVVRSTIDQSPFLPEAYIKDLKKQYTTSFALQELYAKIVDMGGSIIDPKWFKLETLNKPERGVRCWDLAVSTKNEADFSSGCLMSKHNNKININHISKVKLSYPDLKKHIMETALSDGTNITMYIETAGQQRAIYDDIRSLPELSQHTIKEFKPTKDKITRSYPFASQAESGNVVVNDEPWKRDFFDECSKFSAENLGKSHDDQIDSVTAAYECLTKNTSIITTRW